MIQFGVMANTHPAPGTDLTRMVDELIAEAQQAERAGFDSFFLTEHHQEPSGYFPSPLPLAAALAARTSTIRLGTGIAILPLYHPTRLAEDCAVIDIISKGRLILGVGQGYQEGDFAAFGLKVSDRVSLFEESIEILRRAWTEDKVYFVGKRYTLRNVMVTPKPVQKPHPPIWVAALGDEPMKRAGRLGDALLADSFPAPGAPQAAGRALPRDRREPGPRAQGRGVPRRLRRAHERGGGPPVRGRSAQHAPVLLAARLVLSGHQRRRRTSTWLASRWSASSSARPTTASSGSRPGTARSAPTTS
jgi:alkanesulfonate monooxygenase SsuD/methylene tetrahydromethanopterin reductase-like flavin-dependent oxidoreductase (luciferase family)